MLSCSLHTYVESIASIEESISAPYKPKYVIPDPVGYTETASRPHRPEI
jgi:hypothetical protein